MFQAGAVIVKAGLVQFPWSWVGPSSNRAGGIEVVVVEPVVDVVDEPAVVVVVSLDFPAVVLVVVEVPAVGAEVVVEPLAVEAVVLVELPPAGGREYAPPPEPEAGVRYPMNSPTRAAPTMPPTSCHVFHERLSLRPREPGAGTASTSCGRTGPMETGSNPGGPSTCDMAKPWSRFRFPSR
jgi:hypothetical protein